MHTKFNYLYLMKPVDTADFQIRWSWYNISRMYNTKANKYGGTMAIGYTLLNIDKDGTPSTKLGPKMGMEPRSLTRMIKSLETKGWIEKRIDKNDKRMVNIYLTKTGITMRNRTRNSVIKFNKTIQEKINESELKTCFKVLNEINTLIDNKEIFKL